MKRLTLQHRDGQHCAVVQAHIAGSWQSVMVLTDTRSSCPLSAEWKARLQARAIGVRFES